TAATDVGTVPTATFLAAWKVPSPFPRSTLTVLLPPFVTARSSLPSCWKSPTATEGGPAPTGRISGLLWKVPSPLPPSTSTVLLELFVKTRSSLPSWLKSPAAREFACTGRLVVMAGLKVPLSLPSSTLTLLEEPISEPRTTMSWCPLPTSATTIDFAPPPTPAGTGSVIGGAKVVVSRVRTSNGSRENRPRDRRGRDGRRQETRRRPPNTFDRNMTIPFFVRGSGSGIRAKRFGPRLHPEAKDQFLL